MCLDPKENEARGLKKKMTVYKTAMLMEPDKKGEVILSVFQAFRYILGKKYRCKDFKTFTVTNFVNKGFHSYKNENRAQRECDTQDEVVLKCRIPRGAMYFEGDNPHQYCSDRIEILGWRYRSEEPGKWRTKGGEIKVIRPEVKQTVRKIFDIVSKFFKGLWRN